MLRVVAAALALAALLLAPGIAVATPGVGVVKALDYLRTQQSGSGCLGNDAASAWGAIAFARGGVAPATVTAGGASLRDCVRADTVPGLTPLSLSRQVLGVVASGGDARDVDGFDALQALRDFVVGGQFGDPAILNDDIFGLQALHAAGVADSDPVVQTLRAHILANQQPSGAWSYGVIDAQSPDVFTVLFADVDTSGQAMAALVATGSAPSDPAVLRAVAWIRTNQGLMDGGCSWTPAGIAFTVLAGGDPLASNTASTSWGLMGLYAAGQDPEGALWTTATGANPVSYLAGMQQADGHFVFQAGAEGFDKTSLTAQVAVSLTGHNFME
jgi:squalene-hopene cyclase-like protein